MNAKYFKDCSELIKQVSKKCERTGCCEDCVLFCPNEVGTGFKCILEELKRNIEWMERINEKEILATDSMIRFIDDPRKKYRMIIDLNKN